ncbi:hypothetical protein BH20ACI4_BH20ACI4_24610 [soil metagenome]
MPEKPLLKPVQRPDLKQSPMEIENKSVFEKNYIAENKPQPKKSETAKLGVKPTSPTLMEFQSKESVIPEWRLELKNAVQKKLRENQQIPGERELFPTPRVINRTVGATALKPEYYVETEEQPVLHENPTVQNALLRIEQSRQKFLADSEPVSETMVETRSKKDFPYYIASRTNEITAPNLETKTPVYTVTKPKLVSSMPAEGFKRDTNKLPPLPKSAKVSTNFDHSVETKINEEIEPLKEEVFEKSIIPEIKISKQKTDDEIGEEEILTEENEDLAPFTMRFNAGLFDLIIGGFSSLILLAPFILLGGEWFTTAGLLAFLATCSIVMFIYMTTAVGMFGKTFGMKMFSLEIIDIEENDYPTFHQAAVSAAVYLLSLALGGSGFLTVFFTDEKRAVHDIVSGTLMVRDFQEETD